MRIVIQRVSEATVTIDGKIKGKIGVGLLVLLGIESEDTQSDIDWLVGKITRLRIFSDSDDKMNHSLSDIDGEVLLISQFTLHASIKKGNRPSYIRSAPPDIAIPLYETFIRTLEKNLSNSLATGTFGADMKVALINDGPVTICIDSKRRE
ncbi:MAG: D-tyrosyl-tRNA(Tyr) deacylase [Verrucomicrobia bacterium]|jgi:D-aminoacyl-tRNA deacylase|nr:D-tyrosyl-tRNA(Tyr) deacylase [Verrucomicrobiota bacterium]